MGIKILILLLCFHHSFLSLGADCFQVHGHHIKGQINHREAKHERIRIVILQEGTPPRCPENDDNHEEAIRRIEATALCAEHGEGKGGDEAYPQRAEALRGAGIPRDAVFRRFSNIPALIIPTRQILINFV